MKRQNNTQTAIKIFAVILLPSMLLNACMGTQTGHGQKIPAATYMGGSNTIEEVSKELRSAGASHVDIFQEWAADFADTAGKNAMLEDTWSDPYKLKADVGKCMDGWDQYGFRIDSENMSLLSIVIYDPYSDVVFVGHAGVLIKCSDHYLFVEKIAFEQPYQATRVNTMDELLEIMSLRPEYFGEAAEAGPFVYNNGEYVGVLSSYGILKKNI